MSANPITGPGVEHLFPQVFSIRDLSPTDRDRMFELFTNYFANVRRQQFESDLDEKQWVVLQRGQSTGMVHGFSTVRILETELDQRPLRAIFNGDTVHHPEVEGKVDRGLQAWLRLTLEVRQQQPDLPLYWLLMTATHKTYCFLPFLFKNYYPSPHWPTPADMARRRDVLALCKFPEEYDAHQGVVRLKSATPYLPHQKPTVSDKRRNPHVTLFTQLNPGFGEGNYLACLTEISRDNLTESGLRLLEMDGE